MLPRLLCLMPYLRMSMNVTLYHQGKIWSGKHCSRDDHTGSFKDLEIHSVGPFDQGCWKKRGVSREVVVLHHMS